MGRNARARARPALPVTPARRRPSRLISRFRFPRATRTVRRSKLIIATCAIAGAATLGACSPAQEGQGNHAVNIAHAYLGTPYVYGGAAPGGFDCSGLTSYVYGRLGKYLPRSAEQQFEYVQKIPQSWAQKGDLIFFGSPGAHLPRRHLRRERHDRARPVPRQRRIDHPDLDQPVLRRTSGLARTADQPPSPPGTASPVHR